MKTAFIRNVSHQIRTPLNAVSGHTSKSHASVNCKKFCQDITESFIPLNKNLKFECENTVGSDVTVKTSKEMLKSIVLGWMIFPKVLASASLSVRTSPSNWAAM